MALKAGTVGVNPDILDNSGRVKAIPAGEHDISFEVDEATGKAGYKIDGGDFHPFEEAGVTLMGWVKPADLSDEGLTFSSGVTLEAGGYKDDGEKIIIDMVIKTTSSIAGSSALVSDVPGTNVEIYIPLTRCNTSTSLEAALNTYYMDEGTEGAYRAAYKQHDIVFNTATVGDRYYHLYGMIPKSI